VFDKRALRRCFTGEFVKAFDHTPDQAGIPFNDDIPTHLDQPFVTAALLARAIELVTLNRSRIAGSSAAFSALNAPSASGTEQTKRSFR
jgi:hypothetical protein